MNEQELIHPDGQQPLLSVVFEFNPRQMPRKIRQVERMISHLKQLCPEAGISYDKKAVSDELVILTLMKRVELSHDRIADVEGGRLQGCWTVGNQDY